MKSGLPAASALAAWAAPDQALVALVRALWTDRAKRSQPDGLAFGLVAGLVVLYGGLAAVASVVALHVVLGMQNDVLRRILVLTAFHGVCLAWLAVQLFTGKPMNLLLNLRPLAGLPFGFRKLYRLRAMLSLGGWWLAWVGPAAAYVVLARSGSLLGFLIAAVGVLSLVAIQGRLSSLLGTWRNRLVGGLLGSSIVLIGMMALCSAILVGILYAADEPEMFEDALADSTLQAVVESRAFAAMAWMPPGLLAGIVERPLDLSGNLGRLAALLAYAGLLGALDRRVVARAVFESRRGGKASRTIPLDRIFRSIRGLSPAVCISLVELESAARERKLRWMLLVMAAICAVPAVGLNEPVIGICASLLPGVFGLNIHRAELLLPTCRIWSESYALPVTLLGMARAMGRVPSLVLATFGGTALIPALVRGGFASWMEAIYILSMIASLVLISDGVYGWFDVRWQTRRGAEKAFPSAGKELASLLLGFLLPLLGFGWVSLYISGTVEAHPAATGVIATLALGASVVVWAVLRRRQRRVVEIGGLPILIGDEERVVP